MTLIFRAPILLSAILLLTVACRSPEQRQADELRSALFELVDEIETFHRQRLQAQKTAMELYEASDVPLKSWTTITRKSYEQRQNQSHIDIAELRDQVTHHTDLELPLLSTRIRAARNVAEKRTAAARRLPQRAKDAIRKAQEAAARRNAKPALSQRRPSRSHAKRSSRRLASPPAPASPPKPEPTLAQLREKALNKITTLDNAHLKLIAARTQIHNLQNEPSAKRSARDKLSFAQSMRQRDVPPLRAQLENAQTASAVRQVHREATRKLPILRMLLQQAISTLEENQPSHPR